MSPTNRTLVRIVAIGLPLLAVGGCLASVLSSSDDDGPEIGVPVPTSEYDLDDEFCFSAEIFGGGGVITNTGDRGRRFRVVARGEDPSAPERDDNAEYVTPWIPAGEQALVLMPPWPWADASEDDPFDVAQFDCTWVVFEP